MPSLCERCEKVQREAFADLHEGASSALRQQLGLRLEPVDSAVASLAPAEPKDPELNWVIGLGLHEPATEKAVERIVAIYEEAKVDRYFVRVAPDAQPDNLRCWLRRAKLAEGSSWRKLARGSEDLEPSEESPLTVREIGAEAAAAFAEMVGEEFRMTPAMKRLVEGSVRRPDWHLYMSFAGDTPVGTGALFVRDGVGYLDFATTRKCFRGLGGQKALIRRRIKDAIDMGCDLLTVQVGSRFELCGDAEQSRKNLFRHGFQEAYCVEGWTPRPRAATDKT